MQCFEAHVCGRGLREPAVGPAARRDEVSQPHVRHLAADQRTAVAGSARLACGRHAQQRISAEVIDIV